MTAASPITQDALVPAGRRGVLLVNVGTPDEPTVPAVRRYLAEFLNDPRVVDLPALGRWLLLNLIILPFRPRRSAHAYQQIWTKDGSPLLVLSKAQREALAARLPEADVELAMRYGNPSLRGAVERLRARGATHLTLVPLYPQYADATTGTTVAAFQALAGDAVSLVTPPFFAEAGFVKAYAERVRRTVEASNAQHVLFSYHGLPVRQVQRVCDAACSGQVGHTTPCPALERANERCYRAQCYATSAAIAQAAGLATHSTSFQSRIKGTKWLGPHTDEVVTMLARQGLRRVAIACPSFVTDCLETLEEIGQRAAETFRAAGGEQLTLVPAVNDDPTFLDALAALIRRTWAAPTGGAA